MMVYLIVFDKKAVEISEKLYKSIEKYIDDNYVDENTERSSYRILREKDILYNYSAPNEAVNMHLCNII